MDTSTKNCARPKTSADVGAHGGTQACKGTRDDGERGAAKPRGQMQVWPVAVRERGRQDRDGEGAMARAGTGEGRSGMQARKGARGGEEVVGARGRAWHKAV